MTVNAYAVANDLAVIRRDLDLLDQGKDRASEMHGPLVELMRTFDAPDIAPQRQAEHTQTVWAGLLPQERRSVLAHLHAEDADDIGPGQPVLEDLAHRLTGEQLAGLMQLSWAGERGLRRIPPSFARLIADPDRVSGLIDGLKLQVPGHDPRAAHTIAHALAALERVAPDRFQQSVNALRATPGRLEAVFDAALGTRHELHERLLHDDPDCAWFGIVACDSMEPSALGQLLDAVRRSGGPALHAWFEHRLAWFLASPGPGGCAEPRDRSFDRDLRDTLGPMPGLPASIRDGLDPAVYWSHARHGRACPR